MQKTGHTINEIMGMKASDFQVGLKSEEIDHLWKKY